MLLYVSEKCKCWSIKVEWRGDSPPYETRQIFGKYYADIQTPSGRREYKMDYKRTHYKMFQQSFRLIWTFKLNKKFYAFQVFLEAKIFLCGYI